MKIKKIKKLKVNSYEFAIEWNKKSFDSSVSYGTRIISIGMKSNTESEVFESLCHELLEIVAIEMHVRFNRPDCSSDFMFVYDHRQHDTMANMFASLISQFIQ